MSVLLAGMIVFRFPLWVSDISVTQIMQQTVEVQNRGTVGGVQSGLNYGMDMVGRLRYLQSWYNALGDHTHRITYYLGRDNWGLEVDDK